MQEFLTALESAVNVSAGIFADSCLIHCQTLEDEPWATYTVDDRTMRESFEDWYFDRDPDNIQSIDCPFPCNPTCPVESRPTDGIPVTEGFAFLITALLLLAVAHNM